MIKPGRSELPITFLALYKVTENEPCLSSVERTDPKSILLEFGEYLSTAELAAEGGPRRLSSALRFTFHILKKLFERAVRRPPGLFSAGSSLRCCFINTLDFH